MIERLRQIAPYIGAGLLVAAFATAAWRMATLPRAGATLRGEAPLEIVRFAHQELNPGVREAFDLVARAYEARHPGVRVVQIPVPDRIYPTWINTQVLGGTAPDVVQLLNNVQHDEVLSRHYLPLTLEMEQPNPYNAGTPLEGVPWRSTFLDGVKDRPAFSSGLLEVFGAPSTVATFRIAANAELLRTIVGHTEPPATFEEFIALCHRAAEWGRTHQRPLTPIAGSTHNAHIVIGRIYQAATRPLAEELDRLGHYRPDFRDLALAYLHGEWSLDHPAVRQGLAWRREIGRQMQPGFERAERNDALFRFAQGHALLMGVASHESTAVLAQSTFPVVVFEVPLPAGAEAVSEGRNATGLVLGIPRHNPQTARALDFLRFATSLEGNETFAQHSHWLPSVLGARPSELNAPFAPRLEGAPIDGFPLEMGGMAETRRVVENLLYLLYQPQGSVDSFAAAYAAQAPAAFRTDVSRAVSQIRRNVMRLDSLVAAYRALGHGEDALAAQREAMNLEVQTFREAQTAYWAQSLRALASPPTAPTAEPGQ